jgi:glycerol kinase
MYSSDAIAAGGQAVQELRVDGGACVNNLLMQFQADLLGIPVVRPRIIETTALGAAWLAALGLGIYEGTDALESHWQVERRFEPGISRDEASARMAQWERAVAQLLCPPESAG